MARASTSESTEMALIDIRCKADPEHVHEVYRPLVDYPATPVCPDCGAETEQAHLPPRARWHIDPIVVFQAHDGTFRFPGDLSGPMTAQYRRQGYQEVELRTSADVRRFEGHINEGQRSVDERRVEHRQEMQERREATSRSDLRHAMRSMTRYGRDVARATMAHNDGKPRQRPRDGGFHVEVMSFDHSNRMESRDRDGRRRRD